MNLVAIFVILFVVMIGFSIPPLYAQSNTSTPSPGFYEISQYAIGTVGIQIIFVESDGSVDPSKYDWSESEMRITEANIKKGLEFLEGKYPFEVGKLEFLYRPSMVGETGVEASTRVTDEWFQHEDTVELVENVLTDTGCGSETDPLATKWHHPRDKYRIHVLSCGNEVRDELNTDWATVIFVPYTANQVNGLAFGFTAGAFIQDSYMTTVNGGGVIPAHEWTHMVGTTDMMECDLFGPEHEACGEKAGYLYMEETDTIPMTNCLMGSTGMEDSIPRLCISDGTKNQMGWVDQNGNNIPDIVENDVIVTLSENQKQSNSSVIIEGIIMLEPVKCKWPQDSASWQNDWSCKDTTINKIIEVTSTSNVKIESKDGEFDSAFEEFVIIVDPLKFDNTEIEIQVKDKITNTIHSSTFQLDLILSEILEYAVPNWIKNNAKWWANDKIDDDTFVSGIEFLIKENIIHVSSDIVGSTSEEIPAWIKNNAKWWSDGVIDDDTFLNGVEYLVERGIISVN